MDFNDSFSIQELQTALDYSNASAVGADNLSCEMLKRMLNHCLNIIFLLLLTKFDLQEKYQVFGVIQLLYLCINQINRLFYQILTNQCL